jgi:Bacterial Ig-like domain
MSVLRNRIFSFGARGTRTRRKPDRHRRRALLEDLERRLVLNATIDPVAVGDNVSLEWTGDTTADNVTVTYNLSALTFTYSDPGHTIDVTPNSGVVNIANNGTSAVSIQPVAPPFNIFALDFSDTVSGNTYNIQSNFGTVDGGVHISNLGVAAGTDTVNLGNATTGSLGAGFPEVFLNYTGGANAAVNVLDSQDSSASTFTISGSALSFSGQPANPILSYSGANISSLTIDGGTGGNTFNVTGTPSGATTTLNKGAGGPNFVVVKATNAGSMLNLVGSGGPDSVTIASGTTILGPVNIDEAPGSTKLIVDLSTDGLPHNLDLSSNGTTGTLSDTLGNLPHNITYNVAALSSLEIDTDPTQDETLNLSFAGGGNPIPTGGSPGLIFNAGDPVAGVTHALNISGELPSGPFASETHNANDQTVFPQVGQYGSIFFAEAPGDGGPGPQTSLDYTGLQPITDTSPATLYTFNDFGFPDQSFSATVPGTLLPGSLEFANIPTPASPKNFETTDVLNKVNVVFNTPTPVSGQPGNGVFGLVNIPTASAGLASLTFNVSTGNANTVDFAATPAAVVTTLNGSTATDITNVAGTGVAAGTTLTLNGGANPDVLNFDAGGLVPTVTHVAPGEVQISVPGAGLVDAFFYNQINVVDVAPIAPVPDTPIVVNSVEGLNLVDALVGAFTFPLPTGVTQPIPASDFTATINWGDGSPTTAGVTTLGANGTYDVTGTHTYTNPGLFPTSLTVNFNGATVTIPAVSGTPATPAVGIMLPATTATSTSSSTVTDGPLVVTAFPIVGTEGLPIASAPIATFIDEGGAHPVGDYAASIAITNSDGFSLMVPGATIVQVGSSAEYTVIAPAFTLPEEGTYQVKVTVTATVGTATYAASGSSLAVIADAHLVTAATQPTVDTTEAAIYPLPVFALPVFSGPVGEFTDDNPKGPLSDFTATIDWGDGTSPTVGTITQPGGVGAVFIVSGSHTYAVSGVNSATNGGLPGHYTIQVLIQDVGGSRLTITNTANVADIPIVLTGILNPASDSGASNSDDITNVTQPDFFGTSQPLSDVSLFATPVGGGTSLPIGTVEAGSDGSWNIASTVALADGHYSITATAIDQFHETTTVAPVVITANLQIDTVGPVITGAFFNRLNGEVDYSIQDPAGAPSGVLLSTLLDSSNYLLTKVHANKAYPGKWIVTNVSETAGAAPNSYDVAVTFNSGREIRGGFYLFTIRDSSNGNSSVQDIAGNHLDGVFYGSFPSGNGINGSDFVAELSGYHDKIFVPQTIIGTASNANGGHGGPPIGAVHSGHFLPIVPVGGGSVFGTDRIHLQGTKVKAAKKETKQVIKVKHVVKVKAATKPVGHANAQAGTTLHDLAIMALGDTTTKTGRKK